MKKLGIFLCILLTALVVWGTISMLQDVGAFSAWIYKTLEVSEVCWQNMLTHTRIS